MTVRVEGVDHSPFEGVKVYAFDGTTYKGYSGTSGKDGQVTFTLPQGNYRFRGDLNGTKFWSGAENHCALPGCSSAIITLPGGNTSSSSVTINYTYDGLSRLTAADYSSGDYYHYAYDAVGNRLNETTAKGETAYTYDPANRLTSVNGQAVQWDDNGNMLADGQAVYKYNTANKLVGVTKGTSNIVYAYSGLGDRLKEIADGVTTDYTLDINAGLTQVLQDGKQTYLYGNQRISQIAETQTGYFLPDALGSMRQMTDSSADLTLARAYDPYGNVVNTSGAGETIYGYAGEIQSNGLVHLRARDYASQLGRFTSRDTWEGDENQPLSFDKWLYGDDNPVINIDPSGMISEYEDNYANIMVSEMAQYQIIIKKDWGAPNQNISNQIPSPNPSSTPTASPTNTCPSWDNGLWDITELETVVAAIKDINSAFGNNKSAVIQHFGGAKMSMSKNACGKGCTYSGSRGIEFLDGTTPQKIEILSSGFDEWAVVHELGHFWDQKSGERLSVELEKYTGGYTKFTEIVKKQIGTKVCDPENRLPGCNHVGYSYRGTPPKGSDFGFDRKEDFAESVTAYVFPIEAQSAVQQYMNVKNWKYGKYLYYSDYTQTDRWKFINNHISTTP